METATSAMTGEATFSCILCFYKYFSTVHTGFAGAGELGFIFYAGAVFFYMDFPRV